LESRENNFFIFATGKYLRKIYERKMEQQNGEPVLNGHTENGEEEGAAKSVELPTEQKSREGSVGSQEGIQLSAIKIITRHDDTEEEEEESGDDDEDKEQEEEIKPKKKIKKKKKKKVAQPAEVLTSTLAKAIRLINEKKEKERQKIKQAEIRKMALEQKKRQEIAGPARVLIHI
jgi:hypothetical protein